MKSSISAVLKRNLTSTLTRSITCALALSASQSLFAHEGHEHGITDENITVNHPC